jgi:hypothetical protein
VPPLPERDDDEFARALGQVLGAGPRTGTQSRQQSRPLTFISGAKEDGTTVWVPAPSDEAGAQRRRPVFAIAAGVLVLGSVAAGAWALSRSAAVPPSPAPVPVAHETVEPTPAPEGEARGQGRPPGNPVPAPAAQPLAPVAPAVAARPEPATPAAPRKRSRERGGAPGFLNVFAEPWANVVIDGRRVGTTPLRSVQLAAGSHRIRLEHPARQPVEKAVVISSGRTELLDVDLERTEHAP